MKKVLLLIAVTIVFFSCQQGNLNQKSTDYVHPYIGTGGEGRIHPAARMPYGMVQLGPDTRKNNSGYNYYDSTILGFSHIHKSGGGCGDFLDILFMPFTLKVEIPENIKNLNTTISFSHDDEHISPGYYAVNHKENGIYTELTATKRCGMHRYSYPNNNEAFVLIDLEHGNDFACTIVPEDNYDTVMFSSIQMLDRHIIEGVKVSTGWADEQHVYFSAHFSEPIDSMRIYSDDLLLKNTTNAEGTNLKAIVGFKYPEKVIVKVGISSVSAANARENLMAEIPHWDFEKIKEYCNQAWEEEMSVFAISGASEEQKTIFYTALYNTLTYPMLYSDHNGEYRGPDHKVHKTNGKNNYSGVVGLWDTFRAANPLLAVVRPDITNDFVITLLDHYRHFGQLPIWTLASNETFQMIGIHSMPVIADAYVKNIRDYDVDFALEAMKESAMKDTIGFSMRQFVGLENYKKYGYVPSDLETEATARTLEYAYDDWCISEMAKNMDRTPEYEYFKKRSLNYRNVFDTITDFARGRFSDGSWRTPFDPFYSSHRKDDFCEGNAWQWTFFVPHDIKGLSDLMGGKDSLERKLERLFTERSDITGKDASGDITGLIGQYAHGNEPSHHIPYIYAYTDSPWKTEEIIRQIMNSQYDTTPNGISGNDDTGQMSAWYVWNAMGMYPYMHGNGVYVIGSPMFEEIILNHPNGKLTIEAENLTEQNLYIQKILINENPYQKSYFYHKDIFGETTKITFIMGSKANKDRGKWDNAEPPSVSVEFN